jgi:hypothetical protein
MSVVDLRPRVSMVTAVKYVKYPSDARSKLLRRRDSSLCVLSRCLIHDGRPLSAVQARNVNLVYATLTDTSSDVLNSSDRGRTKELWNLRLILEHMDALHQAMGS